MMKPAFLLASLLAAVAGCASYDGYNLRPGVSTEAEVRGTMGTPAMEFRNPDGSRELVYPRGPIGTQTFFAGLRADGVVSEIRPVLGEGSFNQIRPGQTTRDDVLRLIGPPGDTMHFALLQQDSWEYRFRDLWGYIAIFSVNFDNNGVVASKFTRRIERGDSKSGR